MQRGAPECLNLIDHKDCPPTFYSRTNKKQNSEKKTTSEMAKAYRRRKRGHWLDCLTDNILNSNGKMTRSHSDLSLKDTTSSRLLFNPRQELQKIGIVCLTRQCFSAEPTLFSHSLIIVFSFTTMFSCKKCPEKRTNQYNGSAAEERQGTQTECMRGHSALPNKRQNKSSWFSSQ